jgi:hypothetical protein
MAESERLSCFSCRKLKPANQFYRNYEIRNGNGFYPYCKLCLKNQAQDRTGKVTEKTILKVLETLNRPFLLNIWEATIEEAKNAKKDNPNVFGMYMKNISMKQYRSFKYSDSVFLHKTQKEEESFLIAKVPDWFMEAVGEGYEPALTERMYRKYTLLEPQYETKTELHKEALLVYVRYRVREEYATEQGNVSEAKEWGKLAETASKNAKISPANLSPEDLQGGINKFSELFQAVEEYEDIIEVLPEFKERPRDKVDLNIWCYINSVRRLKGMEDVDYAEIYKFYDEKLKEYEKIKEHGFGFGENDA